LWVLGKFLFLLLDLVESAFLGEVDFLVLMPNGLNFMVQSVFLTWWIDYLSLFEKKKKRVNLISNRALAMQNAVLHWSLSQICEFHFSEWLRESVIFFIARI
jgi:hypothetical protein